MYSNYKYKKKYNKYVGVSPFIKIRIFFNINSAVCVFSRSQFKFYIID